MTIGSDIGDGTSVSYLQVFRSGCIESISVLSDPPGDTKSLPARQFEDNLISGVHRLLLVQDQLGVEPPVFIMLSLLRVKGYHLAYRPNLGLRTHGFDRDDLLVTELTAEKLDNNIDGVAGLLRRGFDAIWNSAGMPRSIYYNDKGQRVPGQ